MDHSLHSARRRSLLLGAASLGTAVALPSWAQSDFPKGAIKIIVPLTAGGAADVATRAIAQGIAKALGKPVVVENRPGGLFKIGMQDLLSSPADGHTLIHLHNSLASVQAVHKAFDLTKQLAPITQHMASPMLMYVNGDSPHKSVKDLVAYARANAGRVMYSSLGVGSVEHLKSEQLAMAAGFKALNVPYKAGPDMIKGLMSREVDFTLSVALYGKMYIPAGKLRAIAVIDVQRWADMPEIPTIAEARIKVPPLSFWGGFAAHANTPASTVQRLFEVVRTASLDPAVAEIIGKAGMVPVVSKSPEEFREFIAAEVAWMSAVTKDLGLTPTS